MRTGFNPGRRNRNIGTAKQGHGRSNRLVIPDTGLRGRTWTEQLNPHRKFQRLVSGREVVFIVEETHGTCTHACTVEDIRHVLANIPPADWERLDTFVLRQSTRKQRLIRPAWARMFYSADLGLPGRRTLRLGPAIMLEAMDCSAKLKWRTALDPDDQAELARLKSDGHRVTREGHHYVLSMTPKAVRATQLYRTLLHEIGHWIDYLEKVERPAEVGAGEHAELSAAYFRRPKQEREAFAHRYAETTRKRLEKVGVLPFDPIVNLKPGIW